MITIISGCSNNNKAQSVAFDLQEITNESSGKSHSVRNNNFMEGVAEHHKKPKEDDNDEYMAEEIHEVVAENNNFAQFIEDDCMEDIADEILEILA